MGITGILALIVIALALVMIKLIVNGVKAKNWKKVIITVIVFCTVFGLMWYGFISFITSM